MRKDNAMLTPLIQELTGNSVRELKGSASNYFCGKRAATTLPVSIDYDFWF